ncbi:hypothetical protein ABT026_22275 [Streptomyces sp. NPDC002734]|uniref:hypothetical protein n=1 Tax=Streptomyces sp. NPDC002734 TaxID=3154426 RepID=UPI00333482E5
MTHTNDNPPVGDVWRLHHGDREVARLTVTGFDMPWMYADVETLPGFESFRPSPPSRSGPWTPWTTRATGTTWTSTCSTPAPPGSARSSP